MAANNSILLVMCVLFVVLFYLIRQYKRTNVDEHFYASSTIYMSTGGLMKDFGVSSSTTRSRISKAAAAVAGVTTPATAPACANQ